VIAQTRPDFGTKQRTPMTTEERWYRAGLRALASNLIHRLQVRDGCVLVPSKTDEGRRYHVQLIDLRVGTCDCEAALARNPICAHRFAVAAALWEEEYGLKITSIKPAMVAGLSRYLH
jgi:hypothetical protein